MKLNLSIVYIKKSYFKVQRDIIVNTTQVAPNYSVNMDFKGLQEICIYCTKELYSFAVADPTLHCDHPLRLGNILIQSLKVTSWKEKILEKI